MQKNHISYRLALTVFIGAALLAFTKNSVNKKSVPFLGPTALPSAKPKATATFAAGCFWCVEAQFKELKGVESVGSGFEGGHVNNQTYKEV